MILSPPGRASAPTRGCIIRRSTGRTGRRRRQIPNVGSSLGAVAGRVQRPALRRLEGRRRRQRAVVFVVRRVELGAAGADPRCGQRLGPSLAGFNGELYAAWRGAAPTQGLWYSSFDGSNWAPQALIPGAGSAIGPSLAGWQRPTLRRLEGRRHRRVTVVFVVRRVELGAAGASPLWPGQQHRAHAAGRVRRPALRRLQGRRQRHEHRLHVVRRLHLGTGGADPPARPATSGRRWPRSTTSSTPPGAPARSTPRAVAAPGPSSWTMRRSTGRAGRRRRTTRGSAAYSPYRDHQW